MNTSKTNAPVTNITVYTTNRCNLNCSYCYQKSRDGRSMDFATGRRTLDWFIREISGDFRRLVCTFFGGEPLLEFPLIRRMVEHGEREAAKLGKTIRFGVTTNGTLFTREVAQFWRDHEMAALFSIDGNPVAQNRHRRTGRGSGSYRLLGETIPLVQEAVPGVSARLTITPETVDNLLENVQFLAGKGFDSIAPYPQEQCRSREWFFRLDRELRRVANWYIARARAGRYVDIEFITSNVRKIVGEKGKRQPQPCGVGKGYLAVAVDGGIHPCHRFVSSRDFQGAFRLGDVRTGVDPRLRVPFLRLTSRNVLGCFATCDRCRANAVCGGGCLAQNYENTGNLFAPLAQQQYASTIYYEIAGQVLDTLRRNAPEILSKHVLPPRTVSALVRRNQDILTC